MAWIELHQTLPTNKKIMRLCNLLNISKPQAIGHMCLLWLWALDNAPDGDFSQFSNKEIADISEWKKKPDLFASALIESGFLDADKHIHDWFSYAGKLIDQREIQREQSRMRQQRRRDKVKNIPVTNADVTRDKRDENVTVTRSPYPTVPNSTITVPFREREEREALSLAPEKEARKMYGEYKNVSLSDDELNKLKTDYPDYQNRINRLSAYMATSGKTYASHYATIRTWATEDAAKRPGFGGSFDTDEFFNAAVARSQSN